MNPTIVSWNGLSINNGTPFTSVFPPGQRVNISANPITVNRAGNYPFVAGVVPNPQVVVINVIIAAGQNIDTNRELLKQYFNFEDQTRHNLIVADLADSSRQWYLTGFVIRVQPNGEDKNSFLVLIQVEYPYW